MSFPNVIYGRFGDEKVAQSTKIGGSLPLGQKMILPDGREFRHAQAGTAAALAQGKLVMAASTIPDHGCGTADQMAATVNAIGATAVSIKAPGTTAVVKSYYADGEMVIKDATGQGYMYKVKDNQVAAASTVFVVSLQDTDGLIEAIDATTTVGLRTNPYKEVLTRPTGTALEGPIMGVPVIAVSAGFYTWLQTKGLGPHLQTGGTTVIIGTVVLAATGDAGAAHPKVAASTATPTTSTQLGQTHLVSPNDEYGLTCWNIP